ncbi:uncharacterized protein F5147DRAFT_781765 [Suillus discolor]|uniref:Uncharacterized protein n=1 Tax=Suillus discolor TaxID=1912936 RepID=A0A9P7ES62_9AGAM|nr:uncharacterized protein F5147DRAFT_781765 [Suillus discolor]KAG2086102.1 hypothetical protein F5147DRAFT_781765 [Suillus discolor]
MSQIAVLTCDQRDMLKTFLSAFKIARSGSVEEQDDFWENVYSHWFTTWPEHTVHFADIPDDQALSGLQEALLAEAIRCRRRMPGKKWTTPEQEEYLLSFMSKFRESAADKNFDEFFTSIWALWFEKWPEEQVIFKDMPADHVLTPDETKALAKAVEVRQQQLVTWYRWKVNPARLGRSKGARGVLKFDAVLGGGVELKGTRAPQKINIYSHKFYEAKVKHTADAAIATENITSRGPKLNKRREITRRMYSEESESDLKSGKTPKIDDKTKVKAIRELGPMLDRILKYLAHITGGWKFTVLMGGRDPTTGEASVFNYHIGELQSGAQFNHAYKDFDAMQAAFLAFVQNALVFESTLPHESASDEDEESLSDLDSDEANEWEKSAGEGSMSRVEDLLVPGLNTSDLYRMTPQADEHFGDNASSSHTPLDTADASSGLVSMTGASDHLSLAAELRRDSHSAAAWDPIVVGTADFSAFDPHAFTTTGSGIPDWLVTHDTNQLSDSPVRLPNNLTNPTSPSKFSVVEILSLSDKREFCGLSQGVL